MAKPDKPGKPGGGGGGDDPVAVGGARWTGGGTVFSTTGKVLFNSGGVDYVCSGSLVAESIEGTAIVLTAGHCVFDSNDRWSTSWIFVPEYEGGEGFGCRPDACFVADKLFTSAQWYENGDFNHDYAFARFDNVSDLEGYGGQDISFTDSAEHPVYSFGYPHASPYDGQSLTYCSGSWVADAFGSSDYGLKCDMTGGSSGGPWFELFSDGKGKLVSVNSFKYRGGKQKSYMFGPRLGSVAEDLFALALGGSGSGTSSSP